MEMVLVIIGFLLLPVIGMSGGGGLRGNPNNPRVFNSSKFRMHKNGFLVPKDK